MVSVFDNSDFQSAILDCANRSKNKGVKECPGKYTLQVYWYLRAFSVTVSIPGSLYSLDSPHVATILLFGSLSTLGNTGSLSMAYFETDLPESLYTTSYEIPACLLDPSSQ